MRTTKSTFYILLLCVFSGACISEFNAKLPEGEIDLLVVEGNIISNSTMEFTFSKSFSLHEVVPPAGYNDVSVNLTLVGSDGYQSAPATYMGKGVHQLHVKQLDENVSYGIEFEYNGDTYRSELSKPLETPYIDDVNWIQPVEYEEVTIRVSTHTDTSEHSYFMWTYTEDWETTAEISTAYYYDVNTDTYRSYDYPLTYYCWRKNTGRDIMIGSTEKLTENKVTNQALLKYMAGNERFSNLYSIQVKQQSLSKAAYEYYLDKIKDNQGMGGLFTPQPSKIEGNISCLTNPAKKVIGYVEVIQNIATYQIYITRADISIPAKRSDCSMIYGDELQKLTNNFSRLELHRDGWRPVSISMNGVDIMSKVECVDCTYKGGTKNKPDFWPNNHK